MPETKIFTDLSGRSSQSVPLHDYQMNCVTFGVAASSYAANLTVKQNALDLAEWHLMIIRAVH